MWFNHTPWYTKVLVSYMYAYVMAIQGFLIIIYCNTMEKCYGTRRDNHETSLCAFKILIHI